MQYFEVDGDRVDDLIKKIYAPVITEKLTRKTAMKLYPQVSTEVTRRIGIVEALVSLDLLDDDKYEDAKRYLETELYKFVEAMKIGMLFK